MIFNLILMYIKISSNGIVQYQIRIVNYYMSICAVTNFAFTQILLIPYTHHRKKPGLMNG
ncbi:hypothetical protein GCM10027577_40640 [Spirosoma fluminis]